MKTKNNAKSTIVVCLIGAVVMMGMLGVFSSIEARTGTDANNKTVRDTGLVACWHFDENTGTTAYDSSGNNNNGTIYGATWTSGVSGSALGFDGVDDYVGLPAGLVPLNNYTIELWAKKEGTAWQVLFHPEDDIDGYMAVQVGGKWYFYTYVPPGGVESDRYVYSDANAGTAWTHIVATKSSVDGLKLYINGVLEDTNSAATGNSGSGVRTNKIGCHTSRADGSLSGFFDGLIDEIRIYNRALSASEIQAHYEYYEPNLSACWHFDENTGTTAYDSSGNNNHGTIYGAAWTTGVNGSALSFDGVDDYAEVPISDSLNITAQITIEAWIKTTKSLGDIVSKWESPYTPYGLFISSSVAWFRVYNGGTKTDITGATNICDGSWHYIAATYNGSVLSLYVDGKSNALPVSHAGGMTTTTYPLCMGKGQIADYFNGLIDEVRIYNRALSESEIQAHYECYEPNLVACWHFNENTGTTVYDSSGNNNNGTIYGATWTTGVSSSALSFDGTDDYVEVADSSSLRPSSTISVEVWVKIDSVDSDYERILSKYVNIAASYGSYQLITGLPSNPGEIVFTVVTTAGYTCIWLANPVTLGTWNHIVGTYDGAILKIYRNGVLDNSKNWSGDIQYDTNSLYIGRDGYYSAADFDGLIDEARIYNRALNTSEITEHYEYYTPNLTACWHFDESSGTIACDSSGNNNNGTIYGATWTSGVSQSALSFDGVDDYVDIPHSQSLVFVNTISLEAWIKIDPGSYTGGHFICKGAPSGATQTHIGLAQTGSGTEKYNVEFGITANQDKILFGTKVLCQNVWYYVAGVYDGTNMKIYVNDTLDAQTAQSGNIVPNTDPINIGKKTYWPEYKFDGTIDEVRIYNRALSASEIKAHYAETVSVFYDDFESYTDITNPNFTSTWVKKPYNVPGDAGAGSGIENASIELINGDKMFFGNVSNTAWTAYSQIYDVPTVNVSNFVLEFSIINMSYSGSGYYREFHLGMDFRINGENCYRFWYRYTNAAPSKIVLMKVTNYRHYWQETSYVELCSSPWTPSFPESHNIRIECSGPNINVYIDGNTTPSLTATDYLYTSGYIGSYLRCGDGGGGVITVTRYLDDVYLYSTGATVSHAPIYINGNSNFTSANGVTSGNGTAANPYIIENWDINASSANGIDIENTNVYFIVRNCVIHDGKSNSKNGIYFYNVQNGKTDNLTSYNNYYGIYLDCSTNNTITNCKIYNNYYYYGIILSSSSNNNISANHIYNNSYDGIFLSSSSNNNISANHIYNNSRYGLYLHESSNNNLISANQIYNNSYGILLSPSPNNNTISANQIYNNSYGIRLFSSSNNNITNCQVYNNSYGLYIYLSSNNQITNCAIYNNSLYGICLWDSSNNNTVTNCYAYNNSCGISLSYYSNNNLVTNCYVYNNSLYGIWLDSSSNNNITNCTVYNTYYYYGIYLSSSSNNTITNCTAYNNNYHGIWLSSSSNNTITNCYAYNNSCGISLSYSSNNNITDCTVYNNSGYYGGIYLSSSSNNTIITNCTIYKNSNYGILLDSSSNNLIYNNYFNNTDNAYSSGGTGNRWNITKTAGTNIINGSFLGGNYWSNYTGTDSNGDGIGDTPYIIPGGSGEQDQLPLWTSVTANNPPNPPTLISPANNTWTNDSTPYFDWNFSDSDAGNTQGGFHVQIDNVSNFSSVNYEFNSSANTSTYWQFPEGTGYTTLPDGIWYWRVKTKDTNGAWGNWSDVWVIKIDTIMPTVMSNPTIYPAGQTWAKSGDVVTLNATVIDTGSGVDYVTVNVSGINSTLGWVYMANIAGTDYWVVDVTVGVASDGMYYLCVNGSDNAHNKNLAEHIVVRIDNIGPSVIPNPTCYPAGQTWAKNGDTVILNVTTDSDVISTYVNASAINGTVGWTAMTYVGSGYWEISVVLSGAVGGVSYLVVNATDTTGKYNNTKCVQVNVDNTLPINLSILINNGDEYTNSRTVVLTLNATDNLSGCYLVQFRNSTVGSWGAWSDWLNWAGNGTYQYLLSPGDGDRAVAFRVKDRAGNIAVSVGDSIILDTGGPVTTYNITGILGENNWYMSNVSLKLSATDACNVSKLEYRIVYDNGTDTGWIAITNWTAYNMINVTIGFTEGIHNVYYKATDIAGTVESEHVLTIKIDTAAPTVTSVSPAAGATTIAITTTITKTFSESMNQTSVEASFKVYQDGNGSAIAGTYSWLGNQCIFTPSSQLSPNTKYWGNVTTGAKDLAGNSLGAANNTWFITTAGVGVTVNSPNGGEIWKGGSTKWINYTISGGTVPYTVRLYYSTAGSGGPWTFIAFHNQSATGTFNYTWLTPSVNSSNCYVNVTVNDSSTSGYDLSNGAFSIDSTAPTSSVNTISPYWQNTSPLTITATANDTGYSGLASVELWHRYSTDNATWGGWSLFGTDTASPWSWSFTFPNGTGYYQFYSIARDNAGNIESAPTTADAICGYTTGLVSHDPIYINGNSNFTSANGVTDGNGTQGNPYIIENWDINAGSAIGIDIRNTTAYFVIRNCVIHDGKSNSNKGIYFYSVQNGKIEDVTSYNNYYGVYLIASSLTISNNTIISNGYGIVCNYDSFPIISNNTIASNDFTGIRLVNVCSPTILNNTLNNNTYGIDISHDARETVSKMSGNFVNGINIDGSIHANEKVYYYNEHDFVIDNRVCDCNHSKGWTGALTYNGLITLYDCTNVTIRNSNLSNNWDGIHLYGSSNITISNCNISSNNGYGVYCFDHTSPTISNTNLCSNGHNIWCDYYSSPLIFNSVLISGDYGIRCDRYSSPTISNSTITNSGTSDFYMGDDCHPISINTTFDKTKVYFYYATSTITVKYYLHVKVINSTNSPISGATIRVQDNANGTFDQTYTTGSDGWVRWIECIEYVQDSTVTKYYTPHNVTASKTGYITNYASPEPNMNVSKEITIILSVAPGVGVTVNSPNGGEVWKGNTSYWMNYTISGGTAPYTVKLYYSATGPTGTMNFIAYDNRSAAGTFNYTWLTPTVDSANCYLNVSVNDSSASNYDLSNSAFTIDSTLPTSSVNPISPYWQNATPFTITATASDSLSGVGNVTLWYRYSTDNVSFGNWTIFGVCEIVSAKTPPPPTWSWNFTAPNGNGYYEFYSIARDIAGNIESAPPTADALCGVNVTVSDTEKPQTSNVQAIPSIQIQGGKVNITCTVTDNVGVYIVKVNITGPTGFTPVNETMATTITPTNFYRYSRTYTIVGTYYYYIWATDAEGNENKSAVYTFEIQLENQPPAAVVLNSPTSITANSMQLSWTQNTDADFAYYTIYQSTVSGNIGTAICTITAQSTTSYTVTGLSPSTTYYFTVRVYDTGGLYNNSNQVSATTLAVNQPPTANFTFSPSAPTDLDIIQFTDTSTDSDGTIVNWTWNFGDGGISYLQNTTHKYADNGIYTVSLTVRDDYGATDTAIKYITVLNVLPVANFTYSPSNPTTADTIQFVELSNDPDGTIVSWYWEFGDGNNSTAQHPQHKYGVKGSYWVVLTVRDNDGAASNITKKVVIGNLVPTAEFTFMPVLPSTLDSVKFYDNSTDPDGTIIAWQWVFGDGSISTEQNPEHQYTNDGAYNVILTVWDDAYANATISKQIVVLNAPPVARFTYTMGTKILQGAEFNITLGVAGTPGAVINLTLNENNISIANLSVTRTPGKPDEASLQFLFNGSSIYELIVERVSGGGASSVWVILNCTEWDITANHTVFNQVKGDKVIHPLNLTLLFDYIVRAKCIVVFDATQSEDPDGIIQQYFWSFGDNSGGVGVVTQHEYTSPGNYTVTLTVIDDDYTANTTTYATEYYTNKSARNLRVSKEPGTIPYITIIDITELYVGYTKQRAARIDCPADLLITDKTNTSMYIGYKDGILVSNIIDATAITIGDTEIYLIPLTGDYTYKVSGTGVGTYTFKVYEPGDFEPGDFEPGDFEPGDFNGTVHTVVVPTSNTTEDIVELSADGSRLIIKSAEDKDYSLIIKKAQDEFIVSNVTITAGATHTYNVNDWAALETSSEAVSLAVDINSDGTPELTTNTGSGVSGQELWMHKTTEIAGKTIAVSYQGIYIVNITAASQPSAIPEARRGLGLFIKVTSTGNVSNLTITISYKDSDLPADADESTLRMYYWDESLSQWVLVEDSGVWLNNNTVWAKPRHLTIFAPMAEKVKAQEGLHPWVIYGGIVAIAFLIFTAVIIVISRRKERGTKN